jgi:protein-histidine pros-kinase
MTDGDARAGSALAEQFGAFLDAAPDAMVVADRNGTILLANSQSEKLFGYDRGEMVGKPIEILVPERYAHVHPRHRERYALDAHPRPMGTGLELYGRRKDGLEFPVEISLSPLRSDGRTLVMSAVRDISDRKRLEENIRRQSRMKSEFLANMSHELRTPLNSIIGFAELMHDGRVGPMSDEHREYLGDILTSARHLLRLINDVLDLTKVESGKMQFFPESIDLAAVVAELKDLVRTQAAAKAIRLSTDIAPDLQNLILDQAKLKQVLYNYVSNALKFTPERGSVVIRAFGEGAHAFRIEVEDNGVGVHADDIPRLFVEFQQLDAGASKRFQGTGLGLALTKRIVEAQGGRVGVESRPGAGSRFFAVLPRVTTV